MGKVTILAALLTLAASAARADYANFYVGDGLYTLPPRNALIVGVDLVKDSAGLVPLRNPKNDAAVVSDALHKIGFSVTNLNDLLPNPDQITRQNIKKALYDFTTVLKSQGGIGLVYLAGHGFEKNGEQLFVTFDTFIK